jgi:hypothetical protein
VKINLLAAIFTAGDPAALADLVEIENRAQALASRSGPNWKSEALALVKKTFPLERRVAAPYRERVRIVRSRLRLIGGWPS